MQKFLRLSSLDAFDPLPSLGGRVPTPAKAAPPALAPVPGRPHLWRTPAGALAYLPPPPSTPRKPGALPSAPRMPAGALPAKGQNRRTLEQEWFERWLAEELPSGDVEAVQEKWEESEQYGAFLRSLSLSTDKFGALVGQPLGLYLVTHTAVQGVAEHTFLRLWDPDREFLSFSINERSPDKDSLRAAAQAKLADNTLYRRTITRVEPYRSAYLTKILKDMGLL